MQGTCFSGTVAIWNRATSSLCAYFWTKERRIGSEAGILSYILQLPGRPDEDARSCLAGYLATRRRPRSCVSATRAGTEQMSCKVFPLPFSSVCPGGLGWLLSWRLGGCSRGQSSARPHTPWRRKAPLPPCWSPRGPEGKLELQPPRPPSPGCPGSQVAWVSPWTAAAGAIGGPGV